MTQAPIHYTITPLIARNVFLVSMKITPCVSDNGFEVHLPTWIAGSYMLRDFARHIIGIQALDVAGRDVKMTPLSQSSWHVATNQPVTLHYEVYAHDTSVRTAFLDGSGGFFNATSLCLSVNHLANQPHQITIVPPKGMEQWQVATSLPRLGRTPHRGFGQYISANYDELADCPVRMGQLTWLKFEAHGTPHEVAIAGAVAQLDQARLTEDLQTICQAQIALFEPETCRAPFEHYVFLVDARSEGYGGLEHRSSTALLCCRDDLPRLVDADEPRSEAYLYFLGLCSHEYFHSWNVKRIKPTGFVPYDLTQVVNTSLLWFFEGVTSYYDDLILVRTGLLTQEQYFKRIENNLNTVLRFDGHNVQSLAESGYYAWTKYYQTSPNTPNAVVSYYTKGALAALAIDLYIRHNSNHQYSFDDVMRQLWREFGADFYTKPSAKGLTLDDITRVAESFATGCAVFIQSVTQTTQAIDFKSLFAQNEMSLSDPKTAVAQLGATVKKVDGGYQIIRIHNRSAAQKAALAPDDVLLTFNRLKLKQTPDESLSHYAIGHTITVHYLRDDTLCQASFINQSAPHGLYELNPAKSQ
ncbi:PDZ domain-containing protein [Formosimonas limnophila]|uniref:PDZ domain-containing protein n=1 Tax=Formosimonas limnophila TaxID=1384487 RepID=A0A8J3CHY4_9BURK|nr:PDZ domain-containing protein [Formosimonas limnophila]GHA75992.1 PDZ domain-containing protein [Formosimonas limnophila]